MLGRMAPGTVGTSLFSPCLGLDRQSPSSDYSVRQAGLRAPKAEDRYPHADCCSHLKSSPLDPFGTEAASLAEFMYPSRFVPQERHDDVHGERRVIEKPKRPENLAKTFMPGAWCSDASIAFAYSQLAQGRGDARSELLPRAILLMDPAMAFWLTSAKDSKDVQEQLEALELKDRELIICPINDSMAVGQADAGCHWSLLVAWAPKARAQRPHRFCFAHYDSLSREGRSGSRSYRNAERLASRLAGTRVKVSMEPCSNQTNLYDCGIYAIMFTRIILHTVTEGHESSPFVPEGSAVWASRLTMITPRDATKCRARYFKKAVEAGMVQHGKDA